MRQARRRRWEAAAGRPGARSLYLSLMDALTAVNADSLIFIQAAARAGRCMLEGWTALCAC